ncbi:DotI/IcmL/TraM family protein, partial [Staphylococcus pseudintermedius]|uniref:DotI/IcmL/TraM family protein n=1 Tax=Staphylococcus pseudintermedius TaxID=283734 RepID=UPI000D84019B
QVRRVQKRGLIGVAIIVAVSNLVLACVCVVSVWFATHPVREYFASDNGRIFPMIPMSQPYRKASDVIAYAKETIDASFTLDFNNYRGQLENVRARHTQTAV